MNAHPAVIDVTPLPMRFIKKVKFNSVGGCWIWTGYVGSDGYGKFNWENRMVRAHRFSYSVLVGPIPDGIQIDHACFERACVNPAHLRPVTNKQNMEHLAGANRNNRGSGFRNVYRNGLGYSVHIGHNWKLIRGGYFLDLDEAVAAAAALRAKYYTHDDGKAT